MENYGNIYVPWPGWKVVRLLGKGGFGNVYEIERDVFGKKESAAIKIISIPQSQTDLELDYSEGYTKAEITQKYREYVGGIVSEYQLMTEMKGHSNIVSCEDFYTMEKKEGIGWDIYIRMELLTPLLSVVKNKEMTEEDIIHLAKDMCKAISLCEKHQIVHRDIKPENIFLSNFGDYKLGDFGIARTMDHTTQATSAGTKRYMAPEVLKEEKYGRDVDIYSLGLVLYWLLNNRRIPFVPTNRIPTAEETRIANAKRISGEKIPAPINGSPAFKQIVLKACSYYPKDRYQSAQMMLDELNNLGMHTQVNKEEYGKESRKEFWEEPQKEFRKDSQIELQGYSKPKGQRVLNYSSKGDYIAFEITENGLIGYCIISGNPIKVFSENGPSMSIEQRQSDCVGLSYQMGKCLQSVLAQGLHVDSCHIAVLAGTDECIRQKMILAAQEAGFAVVRTISNTAAMAVSCVMDNKVSLEKNGQTDILVCDIQESSISFGYANYEAGVIEMIAEASCFGDWKSNAQSIIRDFFINKAFFNPEKISLVFTNRTGVYEMNQLMENVFKKARLFFMSDAVAIGASLYTGVYTGNSTMKGILLLQLFSSPIGIMNEKGKVDKILEENILIPTKCRIEHRISPGAVHNEKLWLVMGNSSNAKKLINIELPISYLEQNRFLMEIEISIDAAHMITATVSCGNYQKQYKVSEMILNEIDLREDSERTMGNSKSNSEGDTIDNDWDDSEGDTIDNDWDDSAGDTIGDDWDGSEGDTVDNGWNDSTGDTMGNGWNDSVNDTFGKEMKQQKEKSFSWNNDEDDTFGKKMEAKGSSNPSSRHRKNPIQTKCSKCGNRAGLSFTNGYWCSSCGQLTITDNDKTTEQIKTLYLQALQYINNQDYHKAISVLEQIISMDSDCAQLYLRLGNTYNRIGDAAKKVEYYKKALHLDSKDGTIYLNLAVDEYSKGNYRQAEMHITQANNLLVEGNISDVDAEKSILGNAAAIYEKMNKSEKAFLFLKKAKRAGYGNYKVLADNWHVGRGYSSAEVLNILKKHNSKFSWTNSGLNENNSLDMYQEEKKTYGMGNDETVYKNVWPSSISIKGNIRRGSGIRDGIVITERAIYYNSIKGKKGKYQLSYIDFPEWSFSFKKGNVVISFSGEGNVVTYETYVGSDAKIVCDVLNEIKAFFS